MKQEQFKNVYQHIYLSEQQKDKIWKQIQTTSNSESIRKKALLPTRVAVCLGALLMSGMTVFAANELSLMDKLAEAMKILTQNENDLTEDQKNLYEQYGQILDNQIELDHGTLILDAALYDENHLLIPFRYVFHSDVEGYEELTVGTDFHQTSSLKLFSEYNYDTAIFTNKFCFHTVKDSPQLEEIPNSLYLMTNPKITEDGSVSGSLLLSGDEYKTFEQGTLIQLVKIADIRDTVETAEKTDDVYTEFTLGKALEQHELTIDAENAALLKDMGMSIDQISISPLSLCYSGKVTHAMASLSTSVTVILKNGNVVKYSPSGSGYGYVPNDATQNNKGFSLFTRKLFAEPVLLDDIAEIQIHIQNYRGTDIHIPVEIK